MARALQERPLGLNVAKEVWCSEPPLPQIPGCRARSLAPCGVHRAAEIGRPPDKTSGSSIRSCSRRPPRRSRPLPPIPGILAANSASSRSSTPRGGRLPHHPHLHCLVPGGVLAADGGWIACRRRRFFLPVRVPSRLFRRLFLERLGSAGGRRPAFLRRP
ncbi:hypothetical protein GOL95_31910 [Sinorhizobium medicae]|nr:hypothetical protein [Sinorhizobium medicae]MDX1244461.1 hypothetical protein [Sinorhizobium medicae]